MIGWLFLNNEATGGATFAGWQVNEIYSNQTGTVQYIELIADGNANLNIILGYILLGHQDWKHGQIKVFAAFPEDELLEQKRELDKLIVSGRLPVSKHNLMVYPLNETTSKKDLVNQYSSEADLVVLGVNENHLKQVNVEAFEHYNEIGNVLFVHGNAKNHNLTN